MFKKPAIQIKKREIFLSKVSKLNLDLTLYNPVDHVTLKRTYVVRLKELLTYGKHYRKLPRFSRWKTDHFIYIFPIEVVRLYAEYLSCDYVKLLKSSDKIRKNTSSEGKLF